MAGKPQKFKYGHFTNFIEWRRHGARRIRSEFVPSLCAFLWMIAQEYEATIRQLELNLVKSTVPGVEKQLEYFRICLKNLQNIINRIPDNFHSARYLEAVEHIAHLFGIEPDSTVLDRPPVELLKVIEEE